MRRSIAVLPVVAILLLAGCSQTPEPISEESYLTSARNLATWETASDDVLLERGVELCEMLQRADGPSGRSDWVKMYAAQTTDGGGRGDDARVLALLAVDRFCPDMAFD